MSNELKIINYETIAQATGYKKEEIEIIKNTILKGATDSELAYFASVSKTVGLNPFNKEIWGIKGYNNSLLIFAGRDGFLKKAQENPAFNGIRSAAVYENDLFEMDIPNGIISHKVKEADIKKRGKILGGYCFTFRKNGEPTIVYVDFNTYNRNNSVWKSHPETMICKVSECHALKKGFGFGAVHSEFDFDVKDGVAYPINEFEQTDNGIIDLIAKCSTLQDLKDLYELYSDDIKQDKSLLKLMSERKLKVTNENS